MKTKQRIIEQAIKMYNTHGLSNITSRDLAESMQISHGNIEYYFKNKESLLLGIYSKMANEMTTFYNQKEKGLDSFKKFDLLLHELEIFQVKYGFFNLDILEISRNFLSVNELLQETLNKRRDQMNSFFYGFINEGLLVKNEVPDYYLRLKHTIRILITFWVNQEIILSSYDFSKEGEMIEHIWNLIIPFMTEKGNSIYNNLNNN